MGKSLFPLKSAEKVHSFTVKGDTANSPFLAMWIPQLPRQPWSPECDWNHGAETDSRMPSQTQCCWAPAFLWPFPLLLKNWPVQAQQQTSPWPPLGPPGPPLPISIQGVMLCRLQDIPPVGVTKKEGWAPSKCPFVVWLLFLFSALQGTL